MIEWITIGFALLMEACQVTWPGWEPGPGFLKGKRGVWVFTVIVVMLLLSLSYLAYSFVWAVSEVPPIRTCGLVILAFTFLSLFRNHSGFPSKVFWKRLEGGACFTCLVLIAYAKTKGW